MTEASQASSGPGGPATAGAGGPVFPPGRYGRRRSERRRPRWVGWLPVVLGALLGLTVAVVTFQRYGNPQYRQAVVAFELADDHVTVKFEVHKPADRTAVCRVRARSSSGEEVGAADVTVPVGASVTMTYTLPTRDRPVSAEVPRCGPPR